MKPIMKPIAFNFEMVNAILKNFKIETRRVVKNQPIIFPNDCDHSKGFFDTGGNNWACRRCGWGIGPPDGESLFQSPYQIGDTLWVQEEWAKINDFAHIDLPANKIDGYVYKAGWEYEDSPEWRPLDEMPVEAARIFLKVTSVRMEKLQEITPEDARAEGVLSSYETYCQGFKGLWDSIYEAKGFGWNQNPYVWVIGFRRTDKLETSVKPIGPEKLKQLREEHPAGTRVELLEMNDPYTTLRPGDMGTVTYIDDIGTIHMSWDRGSSLGLVYGVDKYRKIQNRKEVPIMGKRTGIPWEKVEAELLQDPETAKAVKELEQEYAISDIFPPLNG